MITKFSAQIIADIINIPFNDGFFTKLQEGINSCEISSHTILYTGEVIVRISDVREYLAS